MRKFHKYPFTTLLLLSCVIITAIYFFNNQRLYQDYAKKPLEAPEFTAVFQAISDGIYPWSKAVTISASNKTQSTISQQTSSIKPQDVDDDKPSKDTSISDNDTTKDTKQDTKKSEIRSNNTNSETSTKKNKVVYKEVKTDYFDDALFIGDSRTVGLCDYSGWDNATYYADVGMTIYDIFERKVAKVGKKEMTIPSALKKRQFKKIYLCLGINELGRGDEEKFAKQYDKVIRDLKELQPDAIIYIQSIMNVSAEKSKNDKIFNNKQIAKRNKAIMKLADNQTIFYLNINKAVVDDSGAIPEDYTFDGVHLKAKYYKLWTSYLLKHAVKL